MRPLTRVSLTLAASRHPSHLTRSMLALCSHDSSLNGPFVTMFAGSVHLSPYFSTVFGLTARKEVCADCWRNQGCGLVSLTTRVVSSVAFTPILSLSASQLSFLGSQLLYSCAPTMP